MFCKVVGFLIGAATKGEMYLAVEGPGRGSIAEEPGVGSKVFLITLN